MTTTQKLTQALKLRAIYKAQLQQLLDCMHTNMNAIERLNKRMLVESIETQVSQLPADK